MASSDMTYPMSKALRDVTFEVRVHIVNDLRARVGLWLLKAALFLGVVVGGYQAKVDVEVVRHGVHD